MRFTVILTIWIAELKPDLRVTVHGSRGSTSDPEFDPVGVLTTPFLAALFVANDSLM